MEPLRESRVVQALLKPPLFFGVPRALLSAELALVCCAWMAAPLHWSSLALTGAVLLLAHPAAALACRENPWAVEMLLAYLRRPVLFSGRDLLAAPDRRAPGTLPR